MADDKNVPGPPLKWYSAAIRYFVIGVSMPVIFPITLPAFKREEAINAAFRQFADLAYDEQNDVWRSPEGLPITVWRVDVVEIPEPFSGILLKELNAMMKEKDQKRKRRMRRVEQKDSGNVVRLFPEKNDSKDGTDGNDPPETPSPVDPEPNGT